ncbi:hypothetical protein H4R34_002376 [Dimargaris verticillata]|uniref:Bestrophin, RFP-TM, chloride channel-domain-containing protein n=1 Tax=Dimargaris verticillata TaxID=2761393 RepID=A0A9W8B2W1_9FUNG|nr:hypothetical protein H4R34_002376 [Dimargaris verticillata]
MYENAPPVNQVPGFYEKVMSFPDVFRLRGSVLGNILPNVLSVTLFATAVAVANDRLGSVIGLPNSLVPSFSVVLGLLLVFRSNSAYDRYWEGRRVWSLLKTNVRNLVRLIWLCAPADDSATTARKLQVVRYLVAYVFATKHYLRGENDIEYEDMADLLPSSFRDHYIESSCNTRVNGGGTTTPIVSRERRSTILSLDGASTSAGPSTPVRVNSHTATVPKRSPPLSTGNSGSSPSFLGRLWRSSRRNSASEPTEHSQLLIDTMFDQAYGNQRRLHAHDMALPLQIMYQINQYILDCRRANVVDPQVGNLMNSNVASLVDCLGNLERIVITPIPLAYRIHLKQSLYLYCFLLPFTLIDLHYYMIPLVTAIAFMLFGIDGIGQEIENPFGYDLNDLPLDQICDDLRKEMEYTVQAFPVNQAPSFAL